MDPEASQSRLVNKPIQDRGTPFPYQSTTHIFSVAEVLLGGDGKADGGIAKRKVDPRSSTPVVVLMRRDMKDADVYEAIKGFEQTKEMVVECEGHGFEWKWKKVDTISATNPTSPRLRALIDEYRKKHARNLQQYDLRDIDVYYHGDAGTYKTFMIDQEKITRSGGRLYHQFQMDWVRKTIGMSTILSSETMEEVFPPDRKNVTVVVNTEPAEPRKKGKAKQTSEDPTPGTALASGIQSLTMEDDPSESEPDESSTNVLRTIHGVDTRPAATFREISQADANTKRLGEELRELELQDNTEKLNKLEAEWPATLKKCKDAVNRYKRIKEFASNDPNNSFGDGKQAESERLVDSLTNFSRVRTYIINLRRPFSRDGKAYEGDLEDVTDTGLEEDMSLEQAGKWYEGEKAAGRLHLYGIGEGAGSVYNNPWSDSEYSDDEISLGSGWSSEEEDDDDGTSTVKGEDSDDSSRTVKPLAKKK